MAFIVRPDFAKSITKGVRTEMMKGFQHAPVDYTKFAMVIKSTQKIETYAWLGQVYKPREWVGQRIPHDVSEYYQTVTNKKYESTMVVEKEALEDEQYGQIPVRARSMGEAAREYINELMHTQLMLGFSTNCYDGQYLIDNDHSEKNSGTQSNVGSSALSGAAVTVGIAEMRQFKDDQGRYLNIAPDTLFVHPDEEGTAREIVLSDRDPDNANNPVNVNKGRFEIIVTPHLTATYWVLARCKGYLKPLIWQDRTGIEFQSDTTMEFWKDAFVYGIRFRGRPAFGDWRLVYGSHG